MIRSKIPLFAFLYGLLVVCAFVSAAEPTPEEMKIAERIFRDVYGKDFDKQTKSKSAADKAAFAKKLWDGSRGTTDNPALARVLADKAYLMAIAEPAAYQIAYEVKFARLAESKADGKERVDQLLAVALVLDKMIRADRVPATRLKLARQLVELYRDAGEECHEQGKDSEAQMLLGKAKDVARQALPPTESAAAIKEIIDDLADYDAERRYAGELKRAEESVRKSPDDPKANQTLGLIHLRTGDTKTAAKYLKLAASEGLKKLADLLDAPATDTVALGDTCRMLAAELPADKACFLGLARRCYERALAKTPPHPDSARLKLLVKELPPFRAAGVRRPAPGTVLEIVDENPEVVDLFKTWPGGLGVAWNADDGFASRGSLRCGIEGRNGFRKGLFDGKKHPVVEVPLTGEFRYAGFAVKPAEGCKSIRLWLGDDAVYGIYTFGAGAAFERGGVFPMPPVGKWTVVTRDLCLDFKQPNFHFETLQIDGDGEFQIDRFYLARSMRNLDKLMSKADGAGK